jgi:4-hydroxy-3-polyprenylbenzoate decarboxylase
VSIRKRYAGQARRVMMAMWGMLVQFSYTKLIIVVDDDIDVRDWRDISWALATRMDPSRDLMVTDHTPIDYLDFASPLAGLGGKLGIDATNKIGSETSREWGRVLAMDPAVSRRIDDLWERLGLAAGTSSNSGARGPDAAQARRAWYQRASGAAIGVRIAELLAVRISKRISSSRLRRSKL